MTLIFADILLLIAHFKFGFYSNERTILDPDYVRQDPRWVNLRTTYKAM